MPRSANEWARAAPQNLQTGALKRPPESKSAQSASWTRAASLPRRVGLMSATGAGTVEDGATASKKRELVGGAKENPVARAPMACSHKVSQPLLTPLQPVTKTRCAFQKLGFITTASKARAPTARALRDAFCLEACPSVAKSRDACRQPNCGWRRGSAGARAPTWSNRLRCGG